MSETLERIADRLEAKAECIRDESYSDAPDWFERKARAEVLREVAEAIREAVEEEEEGCASDT